MGEDQHIFNLMREASPLATSNMKRDGNKANQFQSQARSQSSGDKAHNAKVEGVGLLFQSQARSQSSGDLPVQAWHCVFLCVSISGEKPVLWRPVLAGWARERWQCFNLRREASPLATRVRVILNSRCTAFQ